MSLVDSYMLLKYLCMFSATTALTYDISSRSSIFIVTKLNMYIKIPQNRAFWIWYKCADHDKLLMLVAILASKLQVYISIFLGVSLVDNIW